ncbi:MAG TPA: polymorphic toxin type 35 domain-containing protein [Propionibacteriaceae bacterium]
MSLAMVAVLGGTAAEASASHAPHEGVTVRSDGRLEIVFADPAGATGTVVLGVSGQKLTDIEVEARVDGGVIHDTLEVKSFALTSGDNFRASLRSQKNDAIVQVDSTKAVQQAFPVLLILGLLARLGIRYVIRWYGKAQLKKAAKSYLLNSVSANKWRHIMAPKHKWGSVGAKSKEQVAELMGRAMAEGRHGAHRAGSKKSVWVYKGKTIEVTYASNGGKISNGWVR